jgi:hypothetical protein
MHRLFLKSTEVKEACHSSEKKIKRGSEGEDKMNLQSGGGDGGRVTIDRGGGCE